MRSKVLALLVLLVPSLLVSQGVNAEVCLRGSLLEQLGDFMGVGSTCCGTVEGASCCAPAASCCSGSDRSPEEPSVEDLETCGCCSALSLDPVELAFDRLETSSVAGVLPPVLGIQDPRVTETRTQVERLARTARAPPPGRILAPGLLPGVRPIRI